MCKILKRQNPRNWKSKIEAAKLKTTSSLDQDDKLGRRKSSHCCMLRLRIGFVCDGVYASTWSFNFIDWLRYWSMFEYGFHFRWLQLSRPDFLHPLFRPLRHQHRGQSNPFLGAMIASPPLRSVSDPTTLLVHSASGGNHL